jgi:hypothetical protein
MMSAHQNSKKGLHSPHQPHHPPPAGPRTKTWIEGRLWLLLVVGHEVAQLLGGDVGALVFVLDGGDGGMGVAGFFLGGMGLPADVPLHC